MITHTITRQYKDQSSSTISKQEIVTGNAEANIDETVPVSANHQIGWAITRGNLKSVVLTCDVAVTVFTNDLSTGSPQDTIPIAAGQALIWTLGVDLIANCPFAGDVTTIYVTNAAAGSGEFKIRCVLDQ